MVSSMNWVDGPGGGTPMSAANLDKLAVVADVATAGTPTGDAMKAAYATLTPIAKFGTVGTADDTATFTAAAAAGVAVYVPTGTYRITGIGTFASGAVFCMAPGVVFKPPASFVDGSGAITMFRVWDGNDASTAQITNIGLIGGPWTIDYTGYFSTAYPSRGVLVQNAKQVRIENLTMLNAPFGATVMYAKNGAGTMPEDVSATNIRHVGGGSFGAIQMCAGRRAQFSQLFADEYSALSFELDFGDHTNTIVEDVVADRLTLERPATTATSGMQGGVKFSVPATCRVSRVSVRNVRVLNADGVQLAQRNPYGAGTIEDVTVEDVKVECNNIGHFGVQVDQIDPSNVVIRRLHVTGYLTNAADLRGDVTFYDCVAEDGTGDAWSEHPGTVVAGRFRRFYNCKAFRSNNGVGFSTGSAQRWELYGCVATDSQGTPVQKYGVFVADGSSALLVGCNLTPNKFTRRVGLGTGSTVIERNSPDADTNGSIQTAPPTTANHMAGEVVWNSAAAVGGSNQGWICTTAGEPGTWTPLGALASELMASGEATFDDRLFGTTAQGTAASGVMRFTYFTAKKTETITKLQLFSGTTAAAATPTLVRAGVYSVAANGDMTLVASIASDTTIYAAASTAYLRTLTASFTKQVGQRYAVGELVVSATTMPNRLGVNGTATVLGVAPRRTASLSSQTDLPSTVTAASLGTSGSAFYVELVP